MEPGGDHHARVARPRAATWLTRSEARLGNAPVLAVGFLAATIAALKGGLGSLTMFVWDPSTWPHPVDGYPFMSYGYRAAGALLGTSDERAYIAVSAIATVSALLLIGWAIHRAVPGRPGTWLVMLVLSGPMTWVMVGGFGRTDPLTIAGGVVMGALGRRAGWAVVGACLAALGNPEQAVIIALALCLVSLSDSMRPWRRGALVALVTASAIAVSLDAWARSAGVTTRAALLGDLWKQSVTYFFSSLPLQLYAGFALTLAIVAWALVGSRLRSGCAVAAGVLGVPLAATMVTLDQSRVLVACSSAALVAVCARFAPSLLEAIASRCPWPLSLTVGAVLVLPALEITANVVRVPWALYVPIVQRTLVSPLTGG